MKAFIPVYYFGELQPAPCFRSLACLQFSVANAAFFDTASCHNPCDAAIQNMKPNKQKLARRIEAN